METESIFLRKNHNDTNLTLDGRQEKDIEIDCNHLLGDSTIERFHCKENFVDRKMKKPNGKTGYQLVTLLHEVLF